VAICLYGMASSQKEIGETCHHNKLEEGDSSVAEIDWLLEAKTAYERGNATAALAAALIDIANTLRTQKGCG
jgi:hypothetical protein